MLVRINKFVALATGMSRRGADTAVSQNRVTINGQTAVIGQEVSANDIVQFDNKKICVVKHTTIMLNKLVGYVCSRNGQGSKTIYDLLPAKYHNLKPVGRLDKNSSGLLLLTNDGNLAHQLTHPRFAKNKVYEVVLNKVLTNNDQQQLAQGVQLEDGPSKLRLLGSATRWSVTLAEGRNRQIRRTFAALGYEVVGLHRTQFGEYKLNNQKPGTLTEVK